MTALARPLPDPERSLTRQLDVSTLPPGVRVAVGLAAALLLLWPLLLLAPEALSSAAWSRDVWSAAWFSVWQAALASTFGVVLAIPLGWGTARLFFPGRTLLRALLTLPIITPLLGIALGAGWMLDGDRLLLILVHSGFGLAVGVRLSGGAWSTLDPRAAQTARTLGFGNLQLVRQHYLPALGATFAAAWALSFALAVSAFGGAYLLAPDSTPALSEVVGSPFGGASPVAGASLLLALLAVAALVVFVRYRPGFRAIAKPPERVRIEELSARQGVALVGAAALGLLMVLGPPIALFHGALTTGAAEQVTGANFAAITDQARAFEVDPTSALRRSLVLAFVPLAVALPLGLVVAILVAPLRGWAAVAVEVALLLPLVLPVALAAGLRSGGLAGSSWLWFIHLAIAFPLVVRVVLPGARSRVRTNIEAATVLGASRWTSWRRLVAPALRAHLVLAAVLAAVWSLGEVGAALLLQRLDSAPAPAAIAFALERETTGADGLAFALAAVLVLFASILFVTIEYRRPREITEF